MNYSCILKSDALNRFFRFYRSQIKIEKNLCSYRNRNKTEINIYCVFSEKAEAEKFLAQA